MQFEWDNFKAWKNLKKHGVSFEEASTVFGDPLSLTVADPLHSFSEERFITIGSSARGKTIVVIHVQKGDNIRVVSARRATKRERKVYEQGKKNS